MIDRAGKIRELMEDRILFLDGATGTMLQREGLIEADFRGDTFKKHSQNLAGNNDLLNLTRPDIIEKLHHSFLNAGADIIETNTFNGTSLSQSDYGTEKYIDEINIKEENYLMVENYVIII